MDASYSTPPNKLHPLKTSDNTGDTGETRSMLWKLARSCAEACYLLYHPFRQKNWTILL